MPAHEISLHLTEDDLTALARRFGAIAQPGTTFLLNGDLGTGKSTFARAMIRALAPAEQDIPSPTFTLVQVYDAAGFEVWHSDLYRLSSVDEILELGLVDALADAVCIVEWPDALGEFAPRDAIRIELAHVPDESLRALSITAPFPLEPLTQGSAQ